MSSKNKNLTEHNYKTTFDFSKKKIGVVVSEWNDIITSSLKKGCLSTLEEFGVKSENLFEANVPGSFELPLGAKILLKKNGLDAVVCIGCVVKGETKHDEYINSSVASGIMQLGLISGKPVIFGVLTPNTQEQAEDRAGGKYGNKGVEAAITALKMIELSDSTVMSNSKIGF